MAAPGSRLKASVARPATRSRELFLEAERLIPGGVDSPVRAFGAVGGEPIFIERGAGSRVWDADGNEYIDYVSTWGATILGHAHAAVRAALEEALANGTGFGAPNSHEVELARLICTALPSVEQVRFVSSGTEATMSAVRLARAFTGRELLVKFDGCYHGHADEMLARAGSGVATLGIPSTPGVPAGAAASTLSLPYNDLAAIEAVFAQRPRDIAAVIVEPVACNMGVVPPRDGFLAGLRDLTTRHSAVLIFDEVITGFRVAPGGAQSLFGIRPDVTCLGKVIGGGLPVGAYGGRRELMQLVAPAGPVYQAGTLSGNPLAMAAGAATLRELLKPGAHEMLARSGERLARGLAEAVTESRVRAQVGRSGSLLTLFFNPEPVTGYESALRSDAAAYARFFHRLLQAGIYLPPSQFEGWFLTLAHSDSDIDATVETAAQALAAERSG